jgi:hypothetical protein
MSEDWENLGVIIEKIDATLDLQLEVVLGIQEMLLRLAFLAGRGGRDMAGRPRL